MQSRSIWKIHYISSIHYLWWQILIFQIPQRSWRLPQAQHQESENQYQVVIEQQMRSIWRTKYYGNDINTINSRRTIDAYIYVSNLTIIGSDNGLAPTRRQAIIWTNAGMLLIGPLGINFSKILIKIQTFSSKKMRVKVLYVKWRSFCLGLNKINELVEDRKPFILHS